MRQLRQTWPRYGYRRIWALLRQEGWRVNRKRVQRIWLEKGLRVPAQAPKRRRLGISTVPAARLRAERPNHVWALDFIFDATSDGRPLKALSMCDEFTRENLTRRIGRSITADDGRKDHHPLAGADQAPAALVHLPVVGPADRDKIGEIRRAALHPVAEVVP